MLEKKTDKQTEQKSLRLWTGVIIVALQWLVMFGLPLVMPETGGTAILGGLAGGLLVIVWWLFFSRAPWTERVGAIALMPVAVFATKKIVHASIANAGMGFMFFFYAVPVLSLALVAWAAATRGYSNGLRRASMVAAIVLACGTLTLIRTNGVTGDAISDFDWRWAETAEEKLLAQAGSEATLVSPTPAATVIPANQPVAQGVDKIPSTSTKEKVPDEPQAAQANNEPPAPATSEIEAEWPGFRGSTRDGIIRGMRIITDWSASPPVEMWRRPIGPGWSSFAVRGERFYTQEQRGEEEVIACYDVSTGKPVWMHSDSARFWESNAGAGPRGTPTLSNTRVFTLGGTGILNVLDAGNGAVVWSRNAVSDAEVKVPIWGIASSPLVIDSLVIVAASGRLVAYNLATGEPRWFGPTGGSVSYSSPQLLTIDGVTQILLLSGTGVISVMPDDGTLLWKHEWPGDGIVQPALTADGDLLIASGSGLATNTGMLRANIAHGPGGWTVEERWTSNGLKPYYNDIVIHNGHAFGFDGSILACINLEDGKRKWKGGRYGHGQIVLLHDQDLLLVLSEKGELALVNATPDQFTELARFPAIESKTWNHPVLVGGIMLVRNGVEMAAFRLSRVRS